MKFYESKDKTTESLQSSKPLPSIHNLVGTAQIKHSFKALDLNKISRFLPNCHYDKKKFAAITIRVTSPQCTVLLFTSGKMVLTGCRTFIECISTSLFIVNLLRFNMLSGRLRLTSVNIQNIVGNIDLGNDKLDIQRCYDENHLYCMYQKNMFPGLVYRPDNSPVVLLLFESGKIVITGAKSRQDIIHGWDLLWPFVAQYIKPHPTDSQQNTSNPTLPALNAC